MITCRGGKFRRHVCQPADYPLGALMIYVNNDGPDQTARILFYNVPSRAAGNQNFQIKPPYVYVRRYLM